jgi:hypothetical protein
MDICFGVTDLLDILCYFVQTCAECFSADLTKKEERETHSKLQHEHDAQGDDSHTSPTALFADQSDHRTLCAGCIQSTDTVRRICIRYGANNIMFLVNCHLYVFSSKFIRF